MSEEYRETVLLPFELSNGNDGRGSKWFSSAKIRKSFEDSLRKLRMVRSPLLFPVRVTVTRILGKGQRLWDSSSIGRGSWKELEDALVVCGWFYDDSPKYITTTDFRQDDCRRSTGPAVELEIVQDGPPFGVAKGVAKMDLEESQ